MITAFVQGRDIASTSRDLIIRIPASEVINAEKEYEVTMKEVKRKRSTEANSYMWELIGKISKKLCITPLEVYRSYVKDYGLYRDFTLAEDGVPSFCYAWSRMGMAWITDKLDFSPDGERVVVRAYYGSSCYDTKQMSRLINAVVADCREMGIETRSLEDLDSMMASWRPKL